MKTTMWTDLHAEQCTVLEVDERAGHICSVKISHSELRRPLWFTESRKGNFYWRNTGRGMDAYAAGYIIRGQLDGLVGAPRVYPELAVSF
jgi:hypothetical protein